ncbi:hypothetical protein AYO45_01945 [Gammaproteobacteria bacterium SCGC AG-212-F23]|nr:hypothetical protein AYO45_01945 [Gammaproteobacteria bacterium SCGC AG-212-F23]
MSSKQHSSSEQGLSDLLNYAHLIDEGVIINKDGAFLTSFKFRGPDIHSASGVELDALTANFNRMVTLLEDGWMIHVDELRIPSIVYPKQGCFPDSVSALIDEERRQMYESEGAHYENFQFLTFVWKFPLPLIKSLRHWFVEGEVQKDNDQDLSKLFKQFNETVERCIGLISAHFILEKLNSADLLSYLNTCITGELLPVAVPKEGCFIDVVLGRKNVSGGYLPKIGNKNIYVLSIIGYLNEETFPGLLEQLGAYPLIYRWSNRFIPLSEITAEKEIKRYQKNWNNKVKGITGIIKEVFSGKASEKVNLDALQMSQQTQEALLLNSNRSTRFGYWTSEVVIMHEEINVLEQATKDISRYLEQSGFSCVREEVNAFDAWRGTIPGHGSCNVRRVFINSINLAHVLPLHSIWAGSAYSSSSSLLPSKSPPVFYAATTGKTPFRFHSDVADVGHKIILGPTGAGKSTYLDFYIAQFLRYENAQVFVFDKDYSHKAFTLALGGNYYDIGNAEELSFCPLADLSTDSKKVRAEQFVEDLIFLQNISITPDIRVAIHNAIESLSHPKYINSRNITILQSEIQHEVVRTALRYYTLQGQIKLLDATHDSLRSGYLQTFEMNWLLNQKPEIYLPILRYIFDEIESNLEEANATKPTLIILEEAWSYISHDVFARKLKGWLKTLRKKNARVVFATQSLADLYDPGSKCLTATTAAIMESCPTKVYLPNSSMELEMQELYRKMGLSERQIEIISKIAVPKRHYYITTPEGNRLVDLGLSDVKPLALSFIGLSKKKSKELIECKENYGNEWVFYWLNQCGFLEWSDYWRNKYFTGGINEKLG